VNYRKQGIQNSAMQAVTTILSNALF